MPQSSSSSDAVNHNGTESSLSIWKDISFGSVAGICGKMVEFPFDTIKVRLQTQTVGSGNGIQSSNGRIFDGPIDCLSKTIKNEGFQGLYKGLSSPLLGAIVENAALFFTFHYFEGQFRSWNSSTKPSTAISSTGGKAPNDLTFTQLFVAGALSGTVASFLLTPIELIKCKLQVQEVRMLYSPSSDLSHSPASPSNSLPSFSALPSRRRVVPSTASKSLHQAPLSLSSQQSALSLDQLLSSFPRPSTASTKLYSGPTDVINHVYRTQGFRGFYTGHLGTMIREAGGSAAWFGVYEIVLDRFIQRRQTRISKEFSSPTSNQYQEVTRKDLSIPELLVAGALAGMSYNIVLFPADVIKSRMQTEEEMSQFRKGAGAAEKRRFLEIGIDLYRSEGLSGLYRGLGITLVRSAPASAVIFGVFEMLSRRFG